MSNIAGYVTMASIAFGFLSAGSWLRASVVKVDHDKAMEQRRKDAEKRGLKPNYASVSLDGWDLSATFAAQARWNAYGAFLAACSILLQAVVPLI